MPHLKALFAVALTFTTGATALACPFCSTDSKTLTEEIASMDVALIGRLIEAAPIPKFDDPIAASQEAKPSKFAAVTVIKGDSHLSDKKVVESLYFGDAKEGSYFLLMGLDPPKLTWTTPLNLSRSAIEYIVKLPSVPAKGADRLDYFQNYLENEDELLAADAYDEFAKAPYSEVQDLKDRMKHDDLVSWIKDTDVPASRRRLYLTMLGVCGKSADADMLEKMMASDDRKQKAGLDALIACYLNIRGAEGLPVVEDLFLKNTEAEYADTYAAIMALRFHGRDVDIIPKPLLIKAMRHMLKRPQLADLVIPDLARWEDWESMEQLVTLFKESDDKTSWVRVPVINYLRACPRPEAKEKIAELKKIDPEAVKRANTFFPTPSATGDSTKQKETEQSSSASGLIAPTPSPTQAAGMIAPTTTVAKALPLAPVDAARPFAALRLSLLAGSGLLLVALACALTSARRRIA